MKPTEHNEMENKALKEHLASAALQMLAEGTDYENLAGTTCRFGYLFQIDGHGLEALFQLVTDKGTAYFAAQGDQLLRLSINEALFEGLTATFQELHAGYGPALSRQPIARAVCFYFAGRCAVPASPSIAAR